jgi:hypothetical protein
MLMIRLAGAAIATALLVSGLSGVPAVAGITCDTPSASINAGLNSVSTGLDCPGSPAKNVTDSKSGSRKSRTSAKPACVWVPEPGYQPGVGEKADGDGGHWYRKFCSFGEYDTLADFQHEMSGWDAMNMRQSNMMRRAGLDIRFFTTPPPVERRTPEQVMASVVDDLPIPETFVAVNPVAAKQVVGVPTWVWLTDERGKYDADRYEPAPKEIELEGYTLKWQIVPQLVVSPGAGQEQTCDGAGVPWSAAAEGDQSACTVVYEKAGKYTLSASVGWTVRWWLAGAPQPDIAGPTHTGTKALTVQEIQAVGR